MNHEQAMKLRNLAVRFLNAKHSYAPGVEAEASRNLMNEIMTIEVDGASTLPASTIGTCASCRYWIAAPSWADAYDNLGERACDLASGSSTVKAATRAYAAAKNRGWACLITRPDFGCVQWQPREDPTGKTE